MKTWRIITILLSFSSWGLERAIGGQTLYPIVDSNPPVQAGPSVHADVVHTNQTDTTAGASVELKPSAIAPKGAAGVVTIKGRSLLLHVSGLGPGRYDLQVIRRPAEMIEPLGSLTIIDPTLGPSRQATDNKKEASANPESVLIQTDVEMKVPSELKRPDIVRIVLLGPGGNAVLSGDVK